MSTLKTDNFEELATGDKVPAKYVVHGSAKAWANLNGDGTIALRDSLNISGVVDNGVGDYSFNKTAAMTSTMVLGFSALPQVIYGAFPTGASVRLVTRNGSSTNTDTNLVDIQVQGDLA
jgi:hypothetical protein